MTQTTLSIKTALCYTRGVIMNMKTEIRKTAKVAKKVATASCRCLKQCGIGVFLAWRGHVKNRLCPRKRHASGGYSLHRRFFWIQKNTPMPRTKVFNAPTPSRGS